MIKAAVYSPGASWLDIVLMSEQKGWPSAKFARDVCFKKAVHRPAKSDSSLHIVFAEDIRVMEAAESQLQKSRKAYALVLSGPLFPGVERWDRLSVKDLARVLERSRSNQETVEVPSTEAASSPQEVLKQLIDTYRADSLVQKLQPLFYRVKDPADRQALKKRVFRYLTGRTKTIRDVPIASMQRLLESELAQTFRECVSAYEENRDETVCIRYRVDVFDVNFALHQVNGK